MWSIFLSSLVVSIAVFLKTVCVTPPSACFESIFLQEKAVEAKRMFSTKTT
jgi:hypothetical protein